MGAAQLSLEVAWAQADMNTNPGGFFAELQIRVGNVLYATLNTGVAIASTNTSVWDVNSANMANITITGSNIKWYADAVTTTALPSTTVLTNNASYYATQTISTGSESVRIPVTVSLRNCSWINRSLRFKASK